MGTITFDDGTGSAVFSNGLTGVADGVATRFRGWTPFQTPIGPMETALGSGRSYRFTFRVDYGASFRIEEIEAGNVAEALRLMSWLMVGGVVSVATGDSASRVYTDCVIAPGTEPVLTLADPVELLYTMELSLINVDSPPAPMLCVYTS